MSLKDIIIWLRGLEDLASTVYLAAAEAVHDQPELKEFLLRIAEDEALHYHVLGSAAELLGEEASEQESAIVVDEAVKAGIEAPVRELRSKIESGQVEAKHILTAIVESESSEWNDIFLYVMSTCKPYSPRFQHIAATIQAHEKRIEDFIAAQSDDKGLHLSISSLPGIWDRRLLVAEDDEIMQSLYLRALDRYGEVRIVSNGNEALELLENEFFDLILSDVNMPVLDGVSFMREAVKRAPHLKSHFVICTGRMTQEVSDAAREYGIKILQKPVRIETLHDTVEQVLNAAL